MQIGLVHNALSPDEKMQRRQANLCLYCGGTGHFLRNCPVRTSKFLPPCPVYFKVSGSSLAHLVLPI